MNGYKFMHEAIINRFTKQFSYLTKEDIQKFVALAKAKSLSANHIITNEGDLNYNMVYIAKGLVRMYTIKPSGEERTVHIVAEGDFLISLETVLENAPSKYVIETVELCEMFVVDYRKVDTFINENPKFYSANKFFLQEIITRLCTRLDSFVCLSPEERYLDLINRKPEIFNRLPNRHIASFLGITPVSLSRIRNRVAKR